MIIEIFLLDREEIIWVCELVKVVGVDFVKILIGFLMGGVKVEDVCLMCEMVGFEMGVKVFGGIYNEEEVMVMIEVGVIRIGISVGVVIVFGLIGEGY